MTRHLRDTEFVDFAEGRLVAPRAAHLDTCDACRAQAESIAAALREASVVDVPEPSPLFWDHFSARVREQIACEVPERPGWWTSIGVRALMPLFGALALVIGVFSVTMLQRMAHKDAADVELASNLARSDTSTSVDLDLGSAVDAKNAEVWGVLTAAASDVGVEEANAAGMGARVGAVDHAVTHLSQAELTELGRLLQTELRGSGH